MITTGALFALAAPAAQASLERILPSKQVLAAHHKVLAKKAHKSHAATTLPIYIYVPGPASQTPTTSTDPTDQELCETYAMNCDLVVSTPTIAAPQVEVAPVEVVANDSSSTQSDPVASSTSDASSSSDPSMDSSDEDC
jgi:hypothetical protein